jgi:DNA polymerase-4/DNA polymerase V
MLQIRSWPTVILHLDGDAFFASVFQAVNPHLKGKPVVTGSERGLATAVSYEARKFGIKRGMLTWQIKKICPQCAILDSDYELYELFSQKILGILRSFTPAVEAYSIDEAFADLKGLRRPLNMSYGEIAKSVKDRVESSLGLTVSVGVSLTKSLAKLASSYRKPSGLTVVDGRGIEKLLGETKIEDVWGIGENTSAYLKKFNIKTAFDYVNLQETFIKKHLSKPYFEIWQELQGNQVFELDVEGKQSYKGITRSQTFTPSTNNKDLLWSRVLAHLEDAFGQARKLNYVVGKLMIFLKTQDFHYLVKEIKIQQKTSYPLLIRDLLKKAFDEIYKPKLQYRTTGCHITDFQTDTYVQTSLFSDNKLEEKAKKIYPLFEAKKVDFGTVLFDKKRQEEKKKKTFNIPFLSTKLHELP